MTDEQYAACELAEVEPVLTPDFYIEPQVDGWRVVYCHTCGASCSVYAANLESVLDSHRCQNQRGG